MKIGEVTASTDIIKIFRLNRDTTYIKQWKISQVHKDKFFDMASKAQSAKH